VVVEICHGEGGDDSKIFVKELQDAYLKYASSLDLQSKVVHSSFGHVKIQISGENAGKAFHNEVGKHVVNRVSTTESHGRVHTSVVIVGVFPVSKKINIQIDERDLKIEPVKLSGPGGQNRNKVTSGVRMTHLPTNIQVTIDGRDFHTNKRNAEKMIESKVKDLITRERNAEEEAIKKAALSDSGRGSKIRKYDFKSSLVTDYRNKKSCDLKNILKKGKFNKLS